MIADEATKNALVPIKEKLQTSVADIVDILTNSTLPSPKGFDPSKIDWDHVITIPQRPKRGQKYKGLVIDARIHKSEWDVELEDVVLTGGLAPSLSEGPMPMAAFAEGSMLTRVMAAPRNPSVYWSDIVRLYPISYTEHLTCEKGVDGLAIVTPTGKRTDHTHIDLTCKNLFWSATDPKHPDGTHNDPIQFHGAMDGVTLIRPNLDGGLRGTACIMANSPLIRDVLVLDGDITGARSGFNFGSKTATGQHINLFSTRVNCPVDIYANDAVYAAIRTDRSVNETGGPLVRKGL